MSKPKIERKRIGIEDVLRWAYRDELPKAQAVDGLIVGPAQFGQAWGGVQRVGELMTIIDAPENQWGLVPDLTAMLGPCDDAVRIGAAVNALDDLELGLPEDWSPLADLGDLGELGVEAVAAGLARVASLDAAGLRRLKLTPRLLVVRHALSGGAPDWRADVPEVKVEMGARGRARWFRRVAMTAEDGSTYEIEVDGYDTKLHGPAPGAYRKLYLDPDPVPAVEARAEYEVWHAALGVLVEDLAGLERFAVMPSERPSRPWETGDIAVRRVLPCLVSEAAHRAMQVRPPKKRRRVAQGG